MRPTPHSAGTSRGPRKSPSKRGWAIVPRSAFAPPPPTWQLSHDSPLLERFWSRNSARPSASSSWREVAVVAASAAFRTRFEAVDRDPADPAVRERRALRRVVAREREDPGGDEDDRGHGREPGGDPARAGHRAPRGSSAHASAGAAATRLRKSGLAAWQRAKTSAKSPAPDA